MAWRAGTELFSNLLGGFSLLTFSLLLSLNAKCDALRCINLKHFYFGARLLGTTTRLRGSIIITTVVCCMLYCR